MANVNGSTYGLTILSPIKAGDGSGQAPVDVLRDKLRSMLRGKTSPFCKVPATHMARLSIIDDVFFEGTTAKEDHLKSRYLWFNSNFDGDVASYLDSMCDDMAEEVETIWQHCVGFPGISSGRDKWKQYMTKCQIETTFFFAAVNDMSVDDMLRGLMLKQEFSAFVAENQGVNAAQLQRNYMDFMESYAAAPIPPRGSSCYCFGGQGE